LTAAAGAASADVHAAGLSDDVPPAAMTGSQVTCRVMTM